VPRTNHPLSQRSAASEGCLRKLGGGWSPDQRRGMSVMPCVVVAQAAAWGARALGPRDGRSGVAGGGTVGRLLRRQGGAVLLPPPRMGRNGQTLEDWCPAHGREDLLEEWDEPIKGPHEVTRASMEKVWWRCGKEECGHRWAASSGNRTRGTGCPACAGKVPTATHNFEVYCQETGREELLGEWADRSRRPKDFTPSSRAKVPWHCGECGWVWESTINNRSSSHPRGCPACAGQVVTPTNNLAVWCAKNGREDLLGEWAHRDKAPKDFTPASHNKVPWQCDECAWEWKALISNRTSSNRTGCPECNPRGRKPGTVIPL